MRPLSGTGARLAAVCVLLSAAAVSCAGGQTSVTVQQPSPTSAASPVRMTLPPNTYIVPTTPVPKGCLSGTVAITHHAPETQTSAACLQPRPPPPPPHLPNPHPSSTPPPLP